jgi:hypothetical protein
VTVIEIASRFNGPPASGNGGYSAGACAAAVLGGQVGTARVTLQAPPPLATPLQFDAATGAVTLDGRPVLVGERVDLEIDPVDPVTYDEAHRARERYVGLIDHPFPTCFACGPGRDDGLAIFPGRMDERVVTSSWTPDESLLVDGVVPLPITWAAMDCIGGWSSDIEKRPMVLGRMTCLVEAAPQVGEQHVVMGLWVSTDGRKTNTLATMYDGDGRIVARAMHTWIEVDLRSFGQNQ